MPVCCWVVLLQRTGCSAHAVPVRLTPRSKSNSLHPMCAPPALSSSLQPFPDLLHGLLLLLVSKISIVNDYGTPARSRGCFTRKSSTNSSCLGIHLRLLNALGNSCMSARSERRQANRMDPQSFPRSYAIEMRILSCSAPLTFFPTSYDPTPCSRICRTSRRKRRINSKHGLGIFLRQQKNSTPSDSTGPRGVCNSTKRRGQ